MACLVFFFFLCFTLYFWLARLDFHCLNLSELARNVEMLLERSETL